MTTAAVTAVATMIDPLLPTAAAARLEALRPQPQKRRKPAHAAKIFTAGVSTTAMLGLVAAMGWPTGGGVAQGAAPAAPLKPDVTSPVSPVTLPIPVLPAPTAAPVVTVPPAVVVAPVVVTEPPTTLPAPAPATVAPIVIPVAVPAAQPQVTKKKKVRVAASNTTTKSSG